MSQVSPARGLIPAEMSQERETVKTENNHSVVSISVIKLPVPSTPTSSVRPDNYAAKQTQHLIGKSNSAEGTENCAQSRDVAAAIDRQRELQ